MGDYGITSKGFVLKRLDEIYSQVCTDLKENIGVDPSENPQSILNVLTTIFCDQIASVWEDYSSGYENLFPMTAEGVALDRCMQLGGVSRIGKARTTYFLSCTGKEGTIIPAGALVQTSTSPVRQFQCASIGTITIKNWSSLTIQPIDEISGTFTFSFSIERNATSGDVGTVSSSSKVSKKLTVTSYDDAIEKIIAVLQGFKAFESYGISVKTETNEKGQKIIVLNGAKGLATVDRCKWNKDCESIMISSFQEMKAKLPMQFRLGSFAVKYFVDYTCDSVDDLKSLPETSAMGSLAFVADPPSTYKKDSSGKWILQRSILI